MPKVILTEDGSHSLYSNIHNAAYHSHYGAIDESITIFISSGLDFQLRQMDGPLKIFEMGFGTGLNAFLTSIRAKQSSRSVIYHAIELYPIESKEFEVLNYPEILKHAALFNKLHGSEWNKDIQINDEFVLNKIHGDIIDHEFTTSYDLIYFDAFAPSCQSILWEAELHNKLYNALNPGGCLVTYCAKGAFKRLLTAIGYELQSLPGPGRKKEITRAIKASY